MNRYQKIPAVNTGHMPSIIENEEYVKTATEKQKKV
jgi:hypothetical protein